MTTPPTPPAPPITWLGMTRARVSPGRPLGPPRVLVIHATAGTSPGDLRWLRQGGGDPPLLPVSCHYYLDKAGGITQLVRDEDTAWHCGPSAWTVDGRPVSGSYRGVARLNWLSLGIELSNKNTGVDPYPDAQIAAAVALARHLVARFAIPQAQLVRHLDIAPDRKTDPRNFPWEAFVSAVFAPAPPAGPAPHTAASPILAPPPPGLPAEALARAVWRRSIANGEYSEGDVCGVIVPAYWLVCTRAGVCPVGTLAQLLHETGNLHAALSHRRDRDGVPLRNPAGIGVTGATSPGPAPGFAWDADRNAYRATCSFHAWSGPGGSVEAHVGRLLAYATRPVERTPEQARLVGVAMRARALPARCHGSARTWTELGAGPNPVAGCGWAGKDDTEGWQYGERIAVIARALSEGR